MAGLVSSASITTFSINGVKLTSGLVWKSLERGRGYQKEALEFGRVKRYDMVAIRRVGEVRQAGYAPKMPGTQSSLKGSYSLASVLAQHLGTGWMGAFEIAEDAYAVVGVLPNGAIMATLDSVYTREDALAKLHSTWAMYEADLNSGAGSGKIYAPADFGLSDLEVVLSEIIKPKAMRSEHRLQPIKFGIGLSGAVMLLLAVAAVAALGFGYAYKKHRLKTQLALAQAAALARQDALAAKAKEEAERTRVAEQAVQEIPKPWLTQPEGIKVIHACADAVDRVPLALGGWMFESATCDPSGLVATYRRSAYLPATVAEFAGEVNRVIGAPPTINEAGSSGTVRFGIETLPMSTLEPLPRSEDVLMAVTTRMQEIGLDAEAMPSFGYTEKMYTAAAGADGQPPPTPDWRTSQYTINSVLPPEELFGQLDTTGIYVTTVDMQLADSGQLAWTLKGEIYGQ